MGQLLKFRREGARVGDVVAEVRVGDDSYEYAEIMGEDSLTLHFELPGFLDFPVGCGTVVRGRGYVLASAGEFRKLHTGRYEYTLVLEYEDLWRLRSRRLVNPVDGRLRFSLTATAREHVEMVGRVAEFSVGEVVEGGARHVAYNHNSCLEALGMIAEAFGTEFAVAGRVLHLRRVESGRGDPLPLAYGKGRGFLPGVGRAGHPEGEVVWELFVQGGSRNVNASSYGAPELRVPRDKVAVTDDDGATFRIEPRGSYREKPGERAYARSLGGVGVKREVMGHSIRTPGSVEASLDLSHVYPRREGVVSRVNMDATGEHPLFDFMDETIPGSLDFGACQIAGEAMTIIFQDGQLAGREFEVNYRHEGSGDRWGRCFEIVPQELDGELMPSERFRPMVGDRYAVFHVALPKEYVALAEEELLREAAAYMDARRAPRFTFRGELDGAWARRHWEDVGGRLRLGGYVLFSDDQFQREGIPIRIVGLKRPVNDPYSPELELSDEPMGGSLRGELRRLEAQPAVLVEEGRREAMQFAQRRFRAAREAMGAIAEAKLEGFSASVSPVSVQTMGLLAGSAELQFELRGDPRFEWDGARGVFRVSPGKGKEFNLVHAKLGGVYVGGADARTLTGGGFLRREWILPQFSAEVTDGGARYLYAMVEQKEGSTYGRFKLSREALPLDGGWYWNLLVGVLSSESGGGRSFAPLYGFTEVTPGMIRTGRIVSNDGKTYFDIERGEIGGNIKFRPSLGDLPPEVSGLVPRVEGLLPLGDHRLQYWLDLARQRGPLHDDPFFARGLNGLVRYDRRGRVEIARFDGRGLPEGSRFEGFGMMVRVPREGGRWLRGNPGFGGFSFYTRLGRPEQGVLVHFTAMVPRGYRLEWTTNLHGPWEDRDCAFEWLTGQEGTGVWADYVFLISRGGECLRGLQTNYFYLEESSVHAREGEDWAGWWVRFAQVYDLSRMGAAASAAAGYTSVEGGLLSTYGLRMLQGLAGRVTAGMYGGGSRGAYDVSDPAFWAGGSFEEARNPGDGMIVLRHDGTARLGSMALNGDGSMSWGGSTLRVTPHADLPDLEDLVRLAPGNVLEYVKEWGDFKASSKGFWREEELARSPNGWSAAPGGEWYVRARVYLDVRPAIVTEEYYTPNQGRTIGKDDPRVRDDPGVRVEYYNYYYYPRVEVEVLVDGVSVQKRYMEGEGGVSERIFERRVFEMDVPRPGGSVRLVELAVRFQSVELPGPVSDKMYKRTIFDSQGVRVRSGELKLDFSHLREPQTIIARDGVAIFANANRYMYLSNRGGQGFAIKGARLEDCAWSNGHTG